MNSLSILFILVVIVVDGCSSPAVKSTDTYKANKLFLKTVTINTDETPSIPIGQGEIATQNIRPGYYIVQLQSPITGEMKQSIVKAGVQIFNYLPENAFIVRIRNTPEMTKLGSINSIKWIGLYKSQYKVSPAFNNLALSNTGVIVTVTIQLFKSSNIQTVMDAIEGVSGSIITMSVGSTGNFIRALIPTSQINAIAHVSDVQWIEPYVLPKFMNSIATDIMGASNNWIPFFLNPAGVWSYGFTGTGQAIAIADTGLDIGNSYNNFTYNSAVGDFEASNITAPFHPAFIGKTIHAYALGRPGDFSDPNGHGTHVACSAFGHDTQTAVYEYPYWGSAYGMNDMVFMSIMDANGGLGGLPPDLNTLFSEEYTDTLSPRIASNSWGAPVNGAYDTMAEQVDTFAWNHPDMTILFAAGNSGVDADGDGVVDLGSMASPATSKDVIAVGASQNMRQNVSILYSSLGFTVDPIASNPVAFTMNGMAAFSSRGPTLDGRIKPDIVAPGTAIISARSHQWLFNDDFQGGAGKWTSTSNTWQFSADTSGNSYEGIESNGSNLTGTLNPINPIDIRTAMEDAFLFFNLHFKLTYSDNFTVYYYDADHSVYFPFYSIQPNSGGTGLFYAPVFYNFYTYNKAINYNSANNYAMTLTQTQGFNFALQFSSSSTPTGTAYIQIDHVRVCPSGWGVLGITNPFVSYGSPEDENYIMNGGTSMATPLAAGAVADIRGALVGSGITDPSAALVKAVLINGAVDIYPGQYGTGQYQEEPTIAPNNVEGFGRVNLVNSLISNATKKIYMIDYTAGHGLATGGTRVSYVTVNNNEDPLKITLVWTDYPSTPSASVNIVNVLHFSLTTVDNNSIYPNGLSTYDKRDNVQQITVVSQKVEGYGIYVSGYNVPQGTSTADDQPYALVISGDIKSLSTITPSAISISPSSLSFTAVNRISGKVTQDMAINNSGLQGSTLTWTAQITGATWLQALSYSGTAPSNIEVTADPASLSPGTYTCNIIFTADNATNSPVVFPVILTVMPNPYPGWQYPSSGGCSCSTSGQGDSSDMMIPFIVIVIGFLVIKRFSFIGKNL